MKIVNFLAIATTVAILGGFIIYLVFISFANGFGNGLRSLAATILPIIVLTYVGKYSQLFRSEHRAPLFNVFFIYAVWSVILMMLVRLLHSESFPIAELLFSSTLATIFWRDSSRSFRGILSCSYGVLVGFLVYVIFLLPFVST
ncbi:MAG: hypothetical protein HC873_05475 [Leptolyngbyaceae cyanobacterium SL_1_1]|nr:hypothetical protein [Leptolyngbyaceae cyanobacterium RM2_2_21]NJN04634.1 hypothetical protein [Leptolyngbyaceae cyanobacterium RM1_1_2]NJO09190.1 hypothetical protein [Leptolyngbyaceae cyanobacterium SL_1_1]